MLCTCLRWSASARAHVHTPLPYLANGWADCVQTWCVANDPLDERLTQVRCGVHLRVRTCTPPSNDDASSPARPSPIKASYWCYTFVFISPGGPVTGSQFLFYGTPSTYIPRAPAMTGSRCLAVLRSGSIHRHHSPPARLLSPPAVESVERRT